MDYIELNIRYSCEEQAEILTAELAEYPFESFVTEDGVLKGYIPQERMVDCKGAVDALLSSYGVEDVRYISIETQNWNAQWESNFERVEVGDKLLIRAPFHPSDSSFAREVVIMPKMSFGTGHHATTHLMAEWTIDLGEQLNGAKVLDMGSGTGVLAIVAIKEGADSADAVDIDEWAKENCEENIVVNGVAERVRAILGDVRSVGGESYGVILANINRNILIADMAAYSKMLTAGGVLLISGFLTQDIESLKARGAECGLTFIEYRERNGWVAMRLQKR
ncbi:MAG: 50S ribosomal protein L11 methyltransferase [Rikenellaceae bacterium]